MEIKGADACKIISSEGSEGRSDFDGSLTKKTRWFINTGKTSRRRAVYMYKRLTYTCMY